MDHSKSMVDILSQTGDVIGAKPRHAIDKRVDIYHTVHILLGTPLGEVILSSIPTRQDLPNIYAEKIGTTAATIRRSTENTLQAVQRCLKHELSIDVPLALVGEGMATLIDSHRTMLSLWWATSELPAHYSPKDIDHLVVMPPAQLDHLVGEKSDTLAPSLLFVWQAYKHLLPIG